MKFVFLCSKRLRERLRTAEHLSICICFLLYLNFILLYLYLSEVCISLLETSLGRAPYRRASRFVQSGASSQAKHGGAYFSAVSGSIKDPIAVPGRHEVTGV